MNRFEQLDAFAYEVENAIDKTDTKLKECEDDECGAVLIEQFISLLNSHMTRYMHEFDLTTYDLIGSLEMIKYDFAVNDTSAPEVLGAIEFTKLALVEDASMVFESEEEIDIDIEDEDDTSEY